ncbi:acid-sensing ion channel 3 [Trichonephila inaurata madagascariensis]|uniref:Acid-sensing ion channel 3 n=1 Tax=Trichonephila inaurata madagascariensis TaxID=2747483 RepID=A0A8X7CDB9_9ARAC|nr:acid-sensing ion channel 3 [Trichonephila inaurata madagascariensis]
MLRALAKEFIAYKVSAAGVPYIVNAKSRTRRWLWFIAVISASAFMGYMTINVVLEYLGYPKSLIREGKIETKLTFPAVTFCSLNPILNQNIEETSVAGLLKVKRVLRNATNVQTDKEYRDKCYGDPLCQWSWFSESCTCVESPCLTEFCLMYNSTHCTCSFNFCKNQRFRTCKAGRYIPRKKRPCLCSNERIYKSMAVDTDMNLYDLLYFLNDPDVRQVVELVRNASTYDLADIEEAMLPTPEDLVDYGVNFDSLVIACSFEGSRCFRENFTVLYHPKYGRCYMFNFIGESTSRMEEPLEIYNYGSSSGLQLILHVTHEQAVDLLNHEIGVRVVVHDPHDLPFVAEYGINLRPRDMSAVEVTLSTIERLGPPWGSCIEKRRYTNYEELPGPYSILGCEKACRHYYLMQKCKCTKRQFMRGSIFLETSSKTIFCNISLPEEYDCMEKVIDYIEKGKICKCPPPCKETKYSYTVSSSQLNENYYRAVKAIRTLVNDDEGRLNITNTTGDKRMVGVKVYYSTFQVDKDSEVASYSWETLVANIGGNLGFFMGLTLVTFVEVIEFIWDVIATIIRKPNDSDRRSSNKIYAHRTG